MSRQGLGLWEDPTMYLVMEVIVIAQPHRDTATDCSVQKLAAAGNSDPGRRYGLYAETIQEKMIPGFTVDTGLAQKSLEWVYDCAADERCLLVAANHGIIIQEQTVEI